MSRQSRFFGLILLLVFGLGGLVAPALHAGVHAEVGKQVDVLDTPSLSAQQLSLDDCLLCQSSLFGLKRHTSTFVFAAFVHIEQRVLPETPSLPLLGLVDSRAPPALP